MTYLVQIIDKTKKFFFLNQLIGVYSIDVGDADAILYKFFENIHGF